MKRWISITLCGLLLASFGCLLKTGPEAVRVSGQVTRNGEPMADVIVSLLGTDIYTVTNENGQYSLNVSTVEPGEYTVKAAWKGHYYPVTQQITVENTSLTDVDFLLDDAPYLYADFDDEEVGDLPLITGIRSKNNLLPQIVDNPGDRPGKSVRLTKADVTQGNAEDFYYVLPETIEDKVTVETWLYAEGTSRSIALGVGDQNVSDLSAVSVYLYSNGKIYYYAGGFKDTGATYEAGKWFHLKVVVDVPAQQYDIYVDGEKVTDVPAPFRNDKLTKLNRVGFFMYVAPGNEPQPVYVDSLLVYQE